MIAAALCCLGLLAGFIGGAIFSTRAYRVVLERERAMGDAQSAAWRVQVDALTARAEHLGLMLDERRAYDLKVTPPPMAPVSVGPDEQPLESAFTRELAAVEDEEARQEFEAMIRQAIKADPERPAREIISEVFGG